MEPTPPQSADDLLSEQRILAMRLVRPDAAPLPDEVRRLAELALALDLLLSNRGAFPRAWERPDDVL